ncbi:PAS domain-containing protein [Roseivirga sp. BDSF3-8]|uniref:PAS domain-containing protein n=1 Tax=Roseivirga sp. BDSF3-8 TaxID=3241598 RepID=UPI003531C1DC
MDLSATIISQIRRTGIRSVFLTFFFILAGLSVIALAISFFYGVSDIELSMNEKAKENRFSLQLLHPSAIEAISETQKKETLRLIDQNFISLREIYREDEALAGSLAKAIAAWGNYQQKYIRNAGIDTEAHTDFVNLSGEFKAVSQAAGQQVQKAISFQHTLIAICISFVLLSLIVWYLVIRRNVILPAERLAAASGKVAMGELEETIVVGSNNELGKVAEDINALTTLLQNADSFTREIGNGNLEVDYPGLEGNECEINHLAASLLDMREKMQRAAEDERQRRWITEGLARFSEILRKNNSNLESMADEVISNLVKYLEGNQGAFFVIDTETESEPVLQMRAAYAYDRKKFISKTVKRGQGLVGQAFVEQESIYMTKIPANYVEIRSGLGDSGPRSILIVPLKVNGEIHGVVEVASFEEIPPYRREFAEKVGETIASTISTVKINEQTSQLYRESQEMTEQLRAQEEEMRQNMEEMQATQEEMRRTQQEIGRKEANLSALINNTTDSIVTIDREYRIMVINKVLTDRYKGTNYEGMTVGKNALDFLGDVRDEWKTYYDRALAGERFQFVIRSTVSGEDSYREYSIHPIKVDGQVVGASVFSRDVTEQKLTEIRSKEVMRELQHKDRLFINSFYFLELDHKLTIRTANDHFCKLLGRTENDILGTSVNSLLPDSDDSFTTKLKEMNGEDLWDGEITFINKEGENIRLQGHATFIDDEDDRLDKYVIVMNVAQTQAV